MTFLIERSGVGITILKNSEDLQNAVRRGEQDMVKFLLDAGIDVDEIPHDLDIREPCPYTSLFEAVQGQQVEVVRLGFWRKGYLALWITREDTLAGSNV